MAKTKQKASPGQTFVPEHSYAKAFGVNMKISQKSASILCRVIKNKPLTRARRLLEDLKAGRRSLEGKYYTKTVKAILDLLNSCEKNAEFKNLDIDRLFVHASAHKGTNMRRRRRKGAFGTKLKSTNMEMLLVERGRQPKDKVPKKKLKEQLEKPEQKDAEGVMQSAEEKSDAEIKKEIERLREEQKELVRDVEEAEKGLKETEKEARPAAE